MNFAQHAYPQCIALNPYSCNESSIVRFLPLRNHAPERSAFSAEHALMEQAEPTCPQVLTCSVCLSDWPNLCDLLFSLFAPTARSLGIWRQPRFVIPNGLRLCEGSEESR